MQSTKKLADSMKKGRDTLIEKSNEPEAFSLMRVKLTDHECQVIEMLKYVADQNGKWQQSEKSEKILDTIDDLYHLIVSDQVIKMNLFKEENRKEKVKNEKEEKK